MVLHIFPILIRSVSPPIPCLLSRSTKEFRCLPTVIYLHGLNANRDQVFQDRYREFAEAMKSLGCNLLSMELPGHGERSKNRDIPASQNLIRLLGREEENPFVCFMEDIQKTVDFIVEDKIAGPGEIGVVGMAWGAANALYALRRERRIRCGALLAPVCKITSLMEFRHLQGNPIVEQYEPLNYAEKIAPKPLLFITGEKDMRANPSFASQLYQKLEPEYEALGAMSQLSYIMLAGATHAYHEDMTALLVDWIKKYLLGKAKL
jgi:dienelactone hydrolase